MSHLKLVSISEVKTEKERVDGKVSRQYYSAMFSNPSNPFSRTVSRVFWQQHNNDGTSAEWRGANPAEVRLFIGKLIPGQIVSSQVEAYDITGSDGAIREANSYTTVVFEGENPVAVFKAAGKVMLQAAEITSNVPDSAAF
jgi:hypothetical protein